MAHTIFLRIGQRDRLPLYHFIESLKSFLRILRDFDATICENPKGSFIWEVVSLKQDSPPVVGVSPTPRRGIFDRSDVVEAQILESTSEMTLKGQRTRLMSDAALSSLETIARKTKRFGQYSMFVNGGESPRQESPITETTLQNVLQFTSPKYKTYGSIVGNLEAISVHRGNEFRVWDEKTGKPVRCKFEADQEGLVKSFLRGRVIVSGEILSNSAGMAISLNVKELAEAAKRALPTIDEMRGLVKDFTQGKTLKDYLEEIADE